MKKNDLKSLVKSKYGQIALQSKNQNQSSCCGTTACCGELDYTVFSENYENIKGYNPDADLGLGCGIPTEFADIKSADYVLDLGSGAGNDCFVARAIVGEKGKVVGLDFTDNMISKANENVRKLGYDHVEFVKGDIEQMPLPGNHFDVIISNCVLNLVPDKNKAFKEIHRVLKKGGHFCVSDVVIKGELPDKLLHDAEMYAGCVSGAVDMNVYLDIINSQGFNTVIVHKQKEIQLPDEILATYLNAVELKSFKENNTGIFSITVSAVK